MPCAGKPRAICQADVGTSDDLAAIQAAALPAFSYFQMRGKLKRWTMCRPILTVTGALSVSLQMAIDFNVSSLAPYVPLSVGTSAVWNVAQWNTPTYWGDTSLISKNWVGLSGLGYAGSLQFQVNVKNISVQWQSTDFLFESAALL